MARDEYYSYLPHVFSRLKGNLEPEPITKYLFEVSTDRMGLKENREKDLEVAKILSDYKETIYAKHSYPALNPALCGCWTLCIKPRSAGYLYGDLEWLRSQTCPT